MIIKFLGTHNAQSKKTRLISLLIDDILAVDAGSLASELTFTEQEKIKSILLSHGHYDHIKEIPAFAFNNSSHTTKIYATQRTLNILTSRLIDGIIYPKFNKKTSFLKKPSLEFHPLEPSIMRNIDGFKVLPMPVNHPLDSIGFEITDEKGTKIFYTGDTTFGLSRIWEKITPDILIMEVTFPNKLRKIASDSSHCVPETLKKELIDFQQINGYFPTVLIVHLMPQFEKEIQKEVADISKQLKISIKIPKEGDTFHL